MTEPAAVLWDMDGTLVDTEPYWIETEHELAAQHGAIWTHEDALQLVGQELLVSAGYIRERMGLEMSPEEVVDYLLDGVIARVAAHIPWRPGARELLAALRADGIACALVTMSYRRLAEPIVGHLPEGSFAALITGDEVIYGKPDPEAYLAGAAALDVDPRDTIAIEDSPSGTESAVAAGCPTVVVPHHVPVAEGPGRILRASLEGLTVPELTELAAQA